MLILGSSSPRRKQLLEKIGVVVDQIKFPETKEAILKYESPRDFVQRMALEKSASIECLQKDFLITADTIVVKGRRVFGKPNDVGEAEKFLRLLSGSRHKVFTCVCLLHDNKVTSKLVLTTVKMKRLSELEIKSYLNSNEWKGMAGAYAIQGIGSAFVPFLSGSYSNVVGLPIVETLGLLNGAGFRVDFSGTN